VLARANLHQDPETRAIAYLTVFSFQESAATIFISPVNSPPDYQIVESIILIFSGDNTENKNARQSGVSAILVPD
jgi:hypothetical protein